MCNAQVPKVLPSSSCPALVAGLPLAVQILAQTTGPSAQVMGSSQGWSEILECQIFTFSPRDTWLGVQLLPESLSLGEKSQGRL